MRKIVTICASLYFSNVHYLHCQELTPVQNKALQNNTTTICTTEIMADANWQPILNETKNKRIVLLGEFTHGAREIFNLRNDLIRALHEKQGFNTILFESGIGELVIADLDKKEMTPAQMSFGLVGVWRTKEFIELMKYIQSAGISIAGYDVQRTGGSFTKLLTRLALQKRIDTVLYSNIEDRYGVVQRTLSNASSVFDSIALVTNKLIADYRILYKTLENNNRNSSKEFLFALKTILNRINYLEYMLQFVKDRDYNKRWAARDIAMADNIKWLLDTIYKNQKLIIIGHNFHIAKHNPQEQIMGAILKKKYASEMYSLGVFGGGGAYADNSGKTTAMVLSDKSALDIKHVINQLPGFASFLQIPARKNTNNEWLYQNIVVNDTFIDLKKSNTMVLSEQFDGILLIKKISLPEH